MNNRYTIDLDHVRSFLQEQEKHRDQTLKSLWLAANRDFEEIISMIITKYAPKRIYQWGSLLDFSKFSEISDIDIALEGIGGPQEYFSLLGEAAAMTSFPVDIIEIETIDAQTAELIKTYGRLVYECKNL